MGDEEANIEKQVMQQENYLSEDLITQEILTRLSIKSILRFESVSKKWCSTLSSSNFAISHLKKSPFSHPYTLIQTLFIKSGKNYYLFSYDDHRIPNNFEDDLVKLEVDFDVGDGYLQLTGCGNSCNGLICLTCPSKYFLLWNPSTRKLHKYESNSCLKGIVVPSTSFAVCVCGFGYVSSITDYKYVRILIIEDKEDRAIVHVFSVRENRWR
ncbi:hypothetical protein RND81_05G098200 [Saponaria officinalis]|uniref:F-box domain-containing protein n=1 Tax=Saponaria officinalis TaxID=3572 RepID=A0AAW1KRM8_SAPOF